MYEENELYAKTPTLINGINKSAKIMGENIKNNIEHSMETFSYGSDDGSAIRITNATAKWSENSGEDSLSNVSVTVQKGQLLAIIGPVGAGKVYLERVNMLETCSNQNHFFIYIVVLCNFYIFYLVRIFAFCSHHYYLQF